MLLIFINNHIIIQVKSCNIVTKTCLTYSVTTPFDL